METEGLTAEQFSAAVSAVTSAFGDPTRREIYLFARQTDHGVTAGEVAERFELHPNVARHHLDKLAAGGYLDVAVERQDKPGAGRPSKRYRATAKEMGLEFPARRDDLLVTLLGRMLELVPPDAAVQHPVICAVDRGIVRGMLAGLYGDTVPHTEASRPQGDEVCVTSV